MVPKEQCGWELWGVSRLTCSRESSHGAIGISRPYPRDTNAEYESGNPGIAHFAFVRGCDRFHPSSRGPWELSPRPSVRESIVSNLLFEVQISPDPSS